MSKTAQNPATALPVPGRGDWLRDCNACLASAVVHLAAMVGLGLATLAADQGWRGVELVAQVSEGLDSPADTLVDNFTKFELAREESSAAEGPVQLFDVATMATADFADLAAPLDVSASASGLDGFGVGDAGEMLDGGSPGAAEFFGVGGYGGTFVYVVDVSGSMSERGKWERARDELVRSIENLSEEQRYFIIFFSNGWYPMDADEPVPATREQVEETRSWVGQVWPGGGTYPLEALLHALKLAPDAIYFLSDGKFDRAVVEALGQENPHRPGTRQTTSVPGESGQIPIHTIAFVNRQTLGQMRAIARNSGGKFRFVK